ncbi:endothelin-converting enzyme 1 [Trichonephila clavipes]|nr:endothelin-converting enzyme 1 [Trichonephila clavipes]
MTDYQRVDLNEASGSKNMAIEDSPSALNSTNGFSKADENQEKELTGSRRNFWQRRSKMEKYLLAVLIILLLLVLILFIVSVVRVHNTDNKYCTTPACVTAAATILNSLDQTVDPCENFYQYACGGWLKSNPLPEDKTSFSRFQKLSDDNNRILKYVLEDERFELKGEAEKEARIMYRSCMNKTRIEELGAQPLLELLKKVAPEEIKGFRSRKYGSQGIGPPCSILFLGYVAWRWLRTAIEKRPGPPSCVSHKLWCTIIGPSCRNSGESGNFSYVLVSSTLPRRSKSPLSFDHYPGLAHRPPDGYYYRDFYRRKQNSRFRTAKTTIIKFGLHASFVELDSAKSALNERQKALHQIRLLYNFPHFMSSSKGAPRSRISPMKNMTAATSKTSLQQGPERLLLKT